MNEKHYCVCPSVNTPAEGRANQKAALLNDAEWAPGSLITVRFLGGTPKLQQRVRQVAEEWTGIANLEFDFRDDAPTDIRIAFVAGNGSWSYLGKQCQDIAEPEPTMNYGWIDEDSPEAELRRVVLHEFGHALGLIHEHQNPRKRIQWNRAAVRDDLSGPPNRWSDETIDNNMFKVYDELAVRGTDVDTDSIMMYPIPKSWTLDGTTAALNGELSATDRQFIAEAYPKL